MIHGIRGVKISHVQSMVAKRGLTNWANVYVTKSFKAQHGGIPIDPAILATIGHHFIAKMLTHGSEATHAVTRNRSLFLGGLNDTT